MKKLLIALASLFLCLHAGAQVNIDAFSTAYTQDFNTLTSGTWADNTTLAGWYARTDNTASISTYGANTGSSITAGLYAFGVAGTNALTDRALGFGHSNAFTGGSGTGKAYVGWRFKNNTGSNIEALTITWTGEQWRKENVAANTLNLFYQTDVTVTALTSGTWTTASSVFTSPITFSTAGLIDGNAPANRVVGITATIVVSIPAGNEIMLRWEDLNDTGNDQLMGIDDISVTASATSPTTNFYSKSTGALNLTSSWGTNTDGTGTAPTDFVSNYQIFNIRNNATPTIDAAWTVSGANAKVIVGDGTSACNFTIPSSFVATATIDVANAGILTIQNTTAPTLGNLATGSTIDYSNVTITLPSAKTYSNLTLSGTGTKTFPGNTTTVNGNLVLNGTAFDGPGSSPFGTISLGGNLTYIGTVTPPADANQITLSTKGTAAGTQTINAANNVVRWFRIQTTTANTILVNNASNVYLANATSGGLTLLDGSILDLNGNDLQLFNGAGSAFSLNTTGAISGTSTSDIVVERTNSGSLGTIRFVSGSNTIGNLTINHAGAPINTLTLGSPVTVSGILTLTNGVITSTTANSLNISNTAIGAIVGGSATSFVNGPLTWSLPNSGTGDYKFQIGKGTTYLPFNINNPTGASPVVTVEAFTADVDPAATYEAAVSGISHTEYWLASNTGTFTSGTISLAKAAVGVYNTVANSTLAAGSYSSLGGSVTSTLVASNTVSAANPSNALAYFVLATANTAPVNFIHFSGVRQSSLNKLSWSTATEMNNTGYDIQSSVDGVNWTTLAFVPSKAASGNSNVVLQYEYKDTRDALGNTYYRLRQVDVDGKYAFSSIVLIKATATTQFAIENVYPNPAKRNTTLWIASPSKDQFNITVTDESGRKYLVRSAALETGSNAIQLNLSTLTAGNYFIKVVNSKGETRSTQFVKQ